MMGALAISGVFAFIVFVLVAARASRQLLVLDVQDGRIARARGRAPGELLHDIADITEHAKSQGRITIAIENGGAVVRTSAEIDDDVAQRLRNVVGRFSLARLRAAPRVANR